MSRRHAFTLIELLVVIGIIALLISMLLPALNKARYQSVLTKCAAQLRQTTNALHIYAVDNKGHFPSGVGLSVSTGGPGVVDVSSHFYASIRRSGAVHGTLFCPDGDPYLSDDRWDDFTGPTATKSPYFPAGEPSNPANQVILGYAVWIPRQTTATSQKMRDPSNTFDVQLEIPTPGHDPYYPAKPGDYSYDFRAPTRQGNRKANELAVISDYVRMNMVAGSTYTLTTADKIAPKISATLSMDRFTPHVYGGGVKYINVGYADGHVESVRGEDAKPRHRRNDRWMWY